MFIIIAREGIDSAKKRPADAPRDEVVDSDLVAGHDLMA